MAAEWLLARLEECLAVLIDYRGKSPPKSPDGIPVLSAKVIKDGRITAPIAQRISATNYELWMRRGFPKKGDIVLTTEGPLGEVAQLDESTYALGQRIVTLRGKDGVLDNTFLKFLLKSDGLQHKLKALATGTTVEGISQKALRSVELPLPAFSEQRAIAHILGTLDDKIELNRRTNETLEAMARALFKSWFVDFDPVRAKAEGRDPELPKALADLFPAAFDNSELGEIPRGWRVGSIGDIADHRRRGIHPNNIDDNSPYIALEHMPRRCIALYDWSTAKGLESGKFEFKEGDFLFGKLRPYFHKVGIAPVNGVCSTDIVVVVPRSEQWYGLALAYISSDEFVEHTNAGSTGTKMPRTNWGDMARFAIVVPDDAVAAAFTEYVQTTVKRILSGIHENRTLAVLRDTLLPKLISGELRVKDAEQAAEAVA